MIRETLKLDEFRARLKAQGVGDRTQYAFLCPMCRYPQSIQSFICAGADEEKANKLIGFSCIGRSIGSPAPRSKPDGKPCNWTLGGLLNLHELEVIDDDDISHPHFMPASPEVAQALEKDLDTRAKTGGAA